MIDEPEMLVIVLSNEPPIRINAAHWPIIASRKNQHGYITVRQGTNERMIIYGKCGDKLRGACLRSGNPVPLIREVAADLGLNIPVNQLIASLPPTDIGTD